MTTKAQDIIRASIAECEAEARRQGWKGPFGDLSEPDCEWVAARVREEIGRMPTHQEWLDVLGPNARIGGKHYEGERHAPTCDCSSCEIAMVGSLDD